MAVRYLKSEPYPWPYNGDLRPENTVFLVIDMQTDFCGPGGYVDKMGYNLSLTRAPIGSIQRVFAAARRGDPAAIRAVELEARRLALAIATIAPVLDPEVVILGGGVGRSGDLLLEPIERELHELSPFRPRILVSALGEDTVLYGAVATALEAGRQEVFVRSRGGKSLHRLVSGGGSS